jgi:hypothetical protein
MRYIDIGPRRILIKDSSEWFNLPEFVQLSTRKGDVRHVRFTGPPFAYLYHLMEIDGHQYVSYCQQVAGRNCISVHGSSHEMKKNYMVSCYDYETGSERVIDFTPYEYKEIRDIMDASGSKDPTSFDLQFSRATRDRNQRRYHRFDVELPGKSGQFDDGPHDADRGIRLHEQMLANAQFALYRVRKVDVRSMFTSSSSEWIQEQLSKLTHPNDTMIAPAPEAAEFFESGIWEHHLFEV